MPTGNELLRLSQIRVTLAVKKIYDSGVGTADETDVGGTEVTFNKTFIDIRNILVSPKGTSAIIAVYDFVDAPNPTSFFVYLFDASGTRVSGDFSWDAEGV